MFSKKSISIAFLLVSGVAVMQHNDVWAGRFDNKYDENVFYIKNVANRLFLTYEGGYNIFNQPIDYNAWQKIIHNARIYVENNSHDLLGRKDSIIIQYFKHVIATNDQVMDIIKTTYDTYIQPEYITYDRVKNGENAVYKLNTIRKRLEFEHKSHHIMKIYNSSTTLSRKKQTIHLIRELGHTIEKICTKAVTDYFKIAPKMKK